MTENEAINMFKNVSIDYKNLRNGLECKAMVDMAVKALEEIQMYKDAKLCLVPEDAFTKQCEELDAYKELGTVEEVREAVEKTKCRLMIESEYKGVKFFQCPECDEMLNGKERYCPECGCRLESEE